VDYPVNGPQHVAIAAIQFNPRDDKIANIDKALSLIDQAASSGARLVVLPEIWTYMGDPDRNRENAEPIPGDLTMRLSERARRHGIYLHAGTFAELVEGDERVRNTAVVFDPEGEIIATYRKIHMFDVTLDGVASYQESATVAPGDEVVTFDLDGVRLGLATCYDLRFPEIFRRATLARGAEILTVIASWPLPRDQHWLTLLRARAIENQAYVIGVNRSGTDPKFTYFGRSLIVDPKGEVIADAGPDAGVIRANINVDFVRQWRRDFPALADARPDFLR